MPQPQHLSLHPIRPEGSVELDSLVVKPRGHEPVALPPYIDWPSFHRWFAEHWNSDLDYGAEHVVIVGQAGSGKTTLAVRGLLPLRPYVVVFGTKTRDSSLYDPLIAQGFIKTDTFDAGNTKQPKVIFVPKLAEPSKEALAAQREKFRKALVGIFQTGGWCVYLDEVRYLSETLKLENELNTLWLQGRSLYVTMVASTQRPVSIPLNAFEQATHSFLFRISGHDDRKRASEFQGMHSPVVFETVGRLPPHELLYIDSVEDVLARTKVER